MYFIMATIQVICWCMCPGVSTNQLTIPFVFFYVQSLFSFATKSTILANLFFAVNVFMRRCKDAAPSESKPGMMDVPINASGWLVHFRTQNLQMLKKLNVSCFEGQWGRFLLSFKIKKSTVFYLTFILFQLKTTSSYQFGPRDTINEGTSLEELIEFGVGRAKYACDVVEVLLKEVKAYSNSGL